MTWLIAARVFSWFEKVIRIHQWRWKNIVVWANHPAGALDKHCCGFYPPLATGTPPMVMVPFCNSWEFDRNGQALPNFLDLCFDLLRTTRKPGLCHHCRSTMKLKRQRIVHFRGPIYIYICIYYDSIMYDMSPSWNPFQTFALGNILRNLWFQNPKVPSVAPMLPCLQRFFISLSLAPEIGGFWLRISLKV